MSPTSISQHLFSTHTLLRRLTDAAHHFLKLAAVRPSARFILRLFSWLHLRVLRCNSVDESTVMRHIAYQPEEEAELPDFDHLQDITYSSKLHDRQPCPTRSSKNPHVCSFAESRIPASSTLQAAQLHRILALPSPPTVQSASLQSGDATDSPFEIGVSDLSRSPYYTEGSSEKTTAVNTPEGQGTDFFPVLENPSQGSLVRRGLNTAHRGFRPLVPENLARYDRSATAGEECSKFSIVAFRTTFLHELHIPGWTIYTHPEGTLVFYHDEQRIFTEVDLFNEQIQRELEDYASILYGYLDAVKKTLDDDVHIVFELVPWPEDEVKENEPLSHYICNYYLVKHGTRTVFWLDDFDASELPIWSEVSGVKSPAQVHHVIEASYWYHCSLYPSSRPWNTAIVDEMRDILVHGIIDTMTSPTSTAPYSLSDMQQMLSVMNSMRKTLGPRIGAMACLSRLMGFFVQQRFYNHHGQPHARLDRDKTVYSSSNTRHSPLITLISPLLFSAPDVHLRSLQKTWVDNIIHHTAYNTLITKLTSEWQEFILYATVMLNANVAFLAIQSIDEEATLPQRSAAQLASYVSILASIGSIILGLLLVRQNRTKTRESAVEAAAYLAKRHHARLGLETLAILWSLPYALLMWAMLSFLASISFLTFQNTTNHIRAGLGTLWCLIAILIVWCITTSWETRSNERNFIHDWMDVVSGVVPRLKRKFSVEAESEFVEGKSAEGDGASTGSWEERRWWSTLLSTRQSSLKTHNAARGSNV